MLGLHSPAATHVYDYRQNLPPREHSVVMHMLSCKMNTCCARYKIVTLAELHLELHSSEQCKDPVNIRRTAGLSQLL